MRVVGAAVLEQFARKRPASRGAPQRSIKTPAPPLGQTSWKFVNRSIPTVTYEELLHESLPARIDSYEQYSETLARFSALVGSRRSRTCSRCSGEALSGKRKISAEQARRLGKLFKVEPGLFI